MTAPIKNDEKRWSTLMTEAQQGNESQYQQLLTELGTAIAAYLRSRFGSIDSLEDCVQESLIAIHRARDTYEPNRLFRPWLFAIVRHKTIDVLRKKANHSRHTLERSDTVDSVKTINGFELNEARSPEYSPLNAAENTIHCGQILAALPDSHREIIVLTKIEGFSVREAAKRLNISESAIKVRIHRALNASRQLLEAEFNS